MSKLLKYFLVRAHIYYDLDVSGGSRSPESGPLVPFDYSTMSVLSSDPFIWYSPLHVQLIWRTRFSSTGWCSSVMNKSPLPFIARFMRTWSATDAILLYFFPMPTVSSPSAKASDSVPSLGGGICIFIGSSSSHATPSPKALLSLRCLGPRRQSPTALPLPSAVTISDRLFF